MANITVTPEQLSSISQQPARRAPARSRATLTQLGNLVLPLHSEWQGAARAAFENLWNEWQTSARNLHDALTGIARLTGQAAANYGRPSRASPVRSRAGTRAPRTAMEPTDITANFAEVASRFCRDGDRRLSPCARATSILFCRRGDEVGFMAFSATKARGWIQMYSSRPGTPCRAERQLVLVLRTGDPGSLALVPARLRRRLRRQGGDSEAQRCRRMPSAVLEPGGV